MKFLLQLSLSDYIIRNRLKIDSRNLAEEESRRDLQQVFVFFLVKPLSLQVEVSRHDIAKAVSTRKDVNTP